MKLVPKQPLEYFPYPRVRSGQAELIKTIYNAVSKGYSVVVEGANGLGKTIAVLSSLLPIAVEDQRTIIYACRTHSQLDRVVEELKAMREKRRNIIGFSLRSRREMCLHSLIREHDLLSDEVSEACANLRKMGLCKFYSKMFEQPEVSEDVLGELLGSPFTATEAVETCAKRGICPYELLRLIVSQATVISVSYLYFFNPFIRSAFLRVLGKPLDKLILVLDEAHNVPDTVAECYSDSISVDSVKRAISEAQGRSKEVERLLVEVLAFMDRASPEEAVIDGAELIRILGRGVSGSDLLTILYEALDLGREIRNEKIVRGEAPRSYVYRVARFLIECVREASSEEYAFLLTRGNEGACLEKMALATVEAARELFQALYAVVCTSGTLEPIPAFVEMAGLPEKTVCHAVPPPYSSENLAAFVCRGVTTSLEKRSMWMFRKIVRRIGEVVRYTPTNVGVFASSYEVLEGLLEAGLGEELEKPIFVEKKGVSFAECEKMLAEFRSCAERGGGVLVGVQGGKLSEGTDFPGKEMESVVIVGVPYAQPTKRVKLRVEYYDRLYPGKGVEYGYIIPAMRKAAQSAGRALRGAEDRAVMVFMDYRFSTPYCRRLLPSWIRENLVVVEDEDGALAEKVIHFFREKPR